MELEDNTEKTKEDQIQWIKGFCEESQATYIKRGPKGPMFQEKHWTVKSP